VPVSRPCAASRCISFCAVGKGTPVRHVRERQRTALLRSRLLAVAGQWQAKDGSTHLIARRLVDVTPWLGELATRSRDFH